MKIGDIEFKDSSMPSFASILNNGDVEMLGVTPLNDGTECIIHVGFGYEELDNSAWFELNLTLDGEWWLSINDDHAAKRRQLESLFKTKFFDDLKSYFMRNLQMIESHPEKGNWTWIEFGSGKSMLNGTFEDHKDEFSLAKIAFSDPINHIDLAIMKESDISECDGGAVAGGGTSAGVASTGSSADISQGTSTTDVLGTFEPGKGVMGVKNNFLPSRVKVPKYRLAGNGGGSKRKKDKNGKDKKYYPEKGMKVITSYNLISETEEAMIEEAIKVKEIEVKNNIKHCKTTEKAKFVTKLPMKKVEIKASDIVKSSKIKQLKVTTKEIKASKESGKIATLLLNDDAKNINIGDIVTISRNKHYKVISKKFIKDISEYPCIEELSNNEIRKIGEAKDKAIIFLVTIGTFNK